MTSVPKINVQTPFLEGVPNSIVSKPWYRFLNALLIANGNSQDIVSQGDFQDEVYTARQADSSAQRQQDLLDRISRLEGQIARLQRAPANDETPALLRSKTSSSTNGISVSDDLVTNGTVYLVWVKNANGAQPAQVSTTKLNFNPSTGLFTAGALQATAGFGCNGQAPQTAVAAGGAAPAGGVGTAAGGWDTALNRDAAITLINNMRSALIANGVMS